jgi:hypothetical protein
MLQRALSELLPGSMLRLRQCGQHCDDTPDPPTSRRLLFHRPHAKQGQLSIKAYAPRYASDVEHLPAIHDSPLISKHPQQSYTSPTSPNQPNRHHQKLCTTNFTSHRDSPLHILLSRPSSPPSSPSSSFLAILSLSSPLPPSSQHSLLLPHPHTKFKNP